MIVVRRSRISSRSRTPPHTKVCLLCTIDVEVYTEIKEKSYHFYMISHCFLFIFSLLADYLIACRHDWRSLAILN